MSLEPRELIEDEIEEVEAALRRNSANPIDAERAVRLFHASAEILHRNLDKLERLGVPQDLDLDGVKSITRSLLMGLADVIDDATKRGKDWELRRWQWWADGFEHAMKLAELEVMRMH